MRACLDCGISLEGMHGNRKRCVACAKAHQRHRLNEWHKRVYYPTHKEAYRRAAANYRRRYPDRRAQYNRAWRRDHPEQDRAIWQRSKRKRGLPVGTGTPHRPTGIPISYKENPREYHRLYAKLRRSRKEGENSPPIP